MNSDDYKQQPADWVSLSLEHYKLAMSASETIWRRSLMMGEGRLDITEAVEMVMEKPTAFAIGTAKASAAMASGESGFRVWQAFLSPISRRASSNARRLRKTEQK